MSGKTDYQQFVEKKHTTFSTPLEKINDVLLKYLHTEIKKAERLLVGESNEVYDAVMKDGRDLIIRITHSEKPEFYREKWAMEAAREYGVLTPQILLVKDISYEQNPRTICVEAKINGTVMSDILEKADLDTVRKFIVNAGEMLSRIHSVVPERFGWIDGEGKGKNSSWKEFILSEFDKRDQIVEKANFMGITEVEIDLAFEILKKHSVIYNHVTPHLLHGDYGPKHLFVRDEKIVGVIDMEHAISGDPANDFAWWHYFRGEKLSIDWLKEGYQDKSVFDDTFELRMHLCELSLSLSLIQYYSEDNNQSGLNKTKGKFAEELKYFEQK